MSFKTTLNSVNLAILLAERLAELMIEVTKGNATAKRRIRLELAGEAGTGDVVLEIRNRRLRGRGRLSTGKDAAPLRLIRTCNVRQL